MRLLYFTHSLRSCWNHGNAHFTRGLLRELQANSHDAQALEPEDSWSYRNLVADQGVSASAAFDRQFPSLSSKTYTRSADLSSFIDGADIVIVHEWNESWLIAALGRMRRHSSRFVLLFHDTHHRAISDPAALRSFDLSEYDGVLAFGEALAKVYRRRGWGRQVHVWHEAADTRLFRPPSIEGARAGLVWIGNWGDNERSEELRSYLLEPARDLGMPLDVHGVRYPPEALASLKAHGARYLGWIANAEVPGCFAKYLATVHVPRRFYAEELPGIPTIRVFEALACGIPLVSAPWQDSEGLFKPGEDYLVARSSEEMRKHLAALIREPALRQALVGHGLDTIRAKHSCAHRMNQLLTIVDEIRTPVLAP